VFIGADRGALKIMLGGATRFLTTDGSLIYRNVFPDEINAYDAFARGLYTDYASSVFERTISRLRISSMTDVMFSQLSVSDALITTLKAVAHTSQVLVPPCDTSKFFVDFCVNITDSLAKSHSALEVVATFVSWFKQLSPTEKHTFFEKMTGVSTPSQTVTIEIGGRGSSIYIHTCMHRAIVPWTVFYGDQVDSAPHPHPVAHIRQLLDTTFLNEAEALDRQHHDFDIA
jgi:hypothetical protein